MLQFWSVAWPTIAALLAIIGLVAGAVGAIPLALGLWREWTNQLYVRRITRRTDPDLVGLDELQQREFDPDVADPVGEVRRYVASSPKRKSAQDPQPIFLAFVLKYNRLVCGYLTAEYFTHSRTIFLWYLVVDKTELPPHEFRQRGSLKLLAAMLKAADRSGAPWEHVITEVEAAIKDLLSARAKLRLFQNAAEELSVRRGRPRAYVFRVPIAYRQPILDPQWLPTARDHEVKAWLLYAPRNTKGWTGKPTITRDLVAALLDTLLLKSYAHAFSDTPAYADYCRQMLDEYLAGLPARMPLEEDVDISELRQRGA